ncbi:MAG: triose-phosphate isomerase [Alphaproteobacteria bacterium]
MKKLIAGNWKMNGSLAETGKLVQEIAAGILGDAALSGKCDLLVCPPYVYLQAAKGALGGSLMLGAQNCSALDNGAMTGDVSAAMLKDAGCHYVILGHSERRQHHGEKSEFVAQKAAKAHDNGLTAIICVGEKELEREQGNHQDIVERQLKGSIPASANAQNTVIAYEPVWAIGTGKTATPADVKAMHAFIRLQLKERLADSENMRILYGGSMKPENAKDLLATPNVDGGLIGGASLVAAQFLAIAKAA